MPIISPFERTVRLVRARTPLRISFAGGGTDVSPYADVHGGCAISSTISLYIYATLEACAECEIAIRSVDYDSLVRYTKEEDFDYNGQMDLAKAVFKWFGAHKIDKSGFNLFAHGDAPPGSGLGSSSTFTVTLIGLFREWLGRAMTTYNVAELAYELERVEIGIKGGKQDQYAAAFGGFNFIEFYGQEVVVTPLRLSPFLLQELEYNLLLCYTGAVRESQHIIARQIDNFESQKPDALAAMHETKQIALEVKKALLLGNLQRFGELLHEGWLQKKQMASGITNSQIDELYAEARACGAIGGKILGAGGGGFLLIYCPFQHKHRITKRLTDLGGQVINFRFEPNGMQTWRVYE